MTGKEITLKEGTEELQFPLTGPSDSKPVHKHVKAQS